MLVGMATDDAHLAVEAIGRVGPGGSFLADPHTIAWMRRGEFYFPGSANLQGETGSAAVDRAHAIAQRLIESHRSPVADAVREELARFSEKYHAGNEPDFMSLPPHGDF